MNDLQTRYTLAGMPEKPWTRRYQLSEHAETRLAVLYTKRIKRFGVLGPESPKKQEVVIRLLELWEERLPDILTGVTSSEIGVYYPTTHFDKVSDDNIILAVFHRIDFVPPLQISSMRALIAKFLLRNAPILITADTEESAQKAMGDLYKEMKLWLTIEEEPPTKRSVIV